MKMSSKKQNFSIRSFAIKVAICSALLLVSAAMVVSLVTYDSGDPSMFNATKAVPNNILGITGSYFADLLYKLLGISGFLIPIFLIFWSVKTIRSENFEFKNVVNFVPFLPLATLGTAVIVNDLSNLPLLNLLGISGGIIGENLSLLKSRFLSESYALYFVNIMFFLLTVLLCLLSLGTNLSDLMKRFLKKDPVKKKKETKNTKIKKQTSSRYVHPSVDLLDENSTQEERISPKQLADDAERLKKVISDYGISGEIVNARHGPVVTLFELKPSPGLKSSRVISLSDDIARSMHSVSARISVLSKKNLIGIEIPNQKRSVIGLKELLSSSIYRNTECSIPLVMGKDLSGNPVIEDLSQMPHLLIAGTTGSGKSVSLNSMIVSMLYKLNPNFCKFIMIDPKMLELSVYNGIPHLITPVVTDPKKAVIALRWLVHEMEERYRKMSRMNVRNINGYNEKVREALKNKEKVKKIVQTGFDEVTKQPIHEDIVFKLEYMPFIVVVVDEMADLMMVAGKEIESCIQRLAQMARASGIHIIMATQRPSVDVITGTIKANFPVRISFQVTSKIDSRTILGFQGAEQLLGKGDLLYAQGGKKVTRVHSSFVSEDEIYRVVEYLKGVSSPDYIDIVNDSAIDEYKKQGFPDIYGKKGEDDELYEQAVSIVSKEGKASTSFIQRKLQIGYNRAARIIEKMEEKNIISPPNHVGKREVFIKNT